MERRPKYIAFERNTEKHRRRESSQWKKLHNTRRVDTRGGAGALIKCVHGFWTSKLFKHVCVCVCYAALKCASYDLLGRFCFQLLFGAMHFYR